MVLRAFQVSDAPMIREASHDPLIPLIASVPRDCIADGAAAFIERQHEWLVSRAGYSFAIADVNDLPVGQIGLWLRSEEPGRASTGYWIRPSARQRGYAADALIALVTWARTLPNLNRLELLVESWNEGSWRAAEKAGFRRERLLRAWQRADGQSRDMFRYSLITA